MTPFVTADHHFWHTGIIAKVSRPYADVEHMNEDMIGRWNAKVRPNDLVYHLGDFSFAGRAKTQPIFDRLNGRKVLVRGNHDPRQTLTLGWYEVHRMIHFTHDFAGALGAEGGGKRPVTLCHFPLEDWAGAHKGALHFHGHSHGRQNKSSSTQKLDVGVDCWDFTPASFDEIAARLNGLPEWQPSHNEGPVQ